MTAVSIGDANIVQYSIMPMQSRARKFQSEGEYFDFFSNVKKPNILLLDLCLFINLPVILNIQIHWPGYSRFLGFIRSAFHRNDTNQMGRQEKNPSCNNCKRTLPDTALHCPCCDQKHPFGLLNNWNEILQINKAIQFLEHEKETQAMDAGRKARYLKRS